MRITKVVTKYVYVIPLISFFMSLLCMMFGESSTNDPKVIVYLSNFLFKNRFILLGLNHI